MPSVTAEAIYRLPTFRKQASQNMQPYSEQNLSFQEQQKLRNNRTGLFLFQLSWILVFVCLIMVNLQIRSNFASWPPAGVERLGALLPTLGTVGLVISSVLAHRALGAFRASEIRPFLSQLRAVMVLGIVFVMLMAYEWLVVPVTGQYSTMFRVMTGFHAAHALVIGLYLWRVYRFTQAGVYGVQNTWAVEAGVKLWDFVTIAWALFFVVLYVI
jgi:heme/copper-type cytochrome/quinol oxidase subunit 3